MPKARRPALDFAVYLVIRIVVAVVQAAPTAWAFGFAELLAAFAYRVDKRHRAVAAENLRFAFPTHSPAAIDRLVRDCYRHFTTMIVELALIPRKLRMANWRTYGRLVHAERLSAGLLSRRPLLIVTAHFGNWEMAGFVLGAHGYRTYAIARVLDNPHLERYLKQFRQATGQTIIAKKDDFDRLADVMRAGGKVATLADQDAGPKGVFVDFFSRPASAHKAVAIMALEFDAQLVVVGVPRVGTPMKYDIVCEAVIDPRDFATDPNPVKAITASYHIALERIIRRYPEQYFWLHRRWKTRPLERKSK